MGELSERSLAPLQVVPIYVKRDVFERHTISDDVDLLPRQIPAEVPTTSVNGVIKEYGTRDLLDEVETIVARQIPAEVPTTSVDGVIKVYGTRDEELEEIFARQIPAEVPTTSENGILKVYGTRDVS